MKKQFYTHLVEISSIHTALERLGLTDAEKEELIFIVEKNMFHTILDTVLSELDPEDKKLFLKHIVTEDDANIWKYLTEKIENIEEKIQKTAEQLTSELHKDIVEAKIKKNFPQK